MPTKTFFNLPAKKRQKLMDAVYAEFARVPYEEVSINQIVKHAGIARGSFYQYFEDKEDLLHFILASYRAEMQQCAGDSLEKNDGDLFAMLLDIFDFTHCFISERKNGEFIRNIFTDIRVNLSLIQQAGTGPPADFMQALASGVKVERLDIRSEQDFGNMLDLLLPITAEAFSRAFWVQESYPQVRARYAAGLELLQRGFAKNKQEAGPHNGEAYSQ